jgi:hypothetical protein
MAENNRLKREMEVRSTQERPKQWVQAELLPEPDKQDGFAYRWVRVSTLNTADPRNLSGMLREGWEPVPVEEQPQMKLLVDPSSRFAGSIEIGRLLLCKAVPIFERYVSPDTDGSKLISAVKARREPSKSPAFKLCSNACSFWRRRFCRSS